jgi:hypothetical protein
MNTQIFDQIAFNTKTLDFTLYINILGVQEQFQITHSKAQYLIEGVCISDNHKIEIETTESHLYYIVALDRNKETSRLLKKINKTREENQG